MLEINLNGDIQTGKTQQLVDLAVMHARKGSKVMFVCPNEEFAMNTEMHRFTGYDAFTKNRVTFCGAAKFARTVISARPEVIIFDELEYFPACSEGDYLAMARSRLANHRFGVLAYSTYSSTVKTKLFEQLKAKWLNELMSLPWYKRIWRALNKTI